MIIAVQNRIPFTLLLRALYRTREFFLFMPCSRTSLGYIPARNTCTYPRVSPSVAFFLPLVH